MKKIKQIVIYLLAAMLVLGFVPATKAQAASPKLSASKLVLIKGQSKTLKVTGASKTVKWSSSKKSVATVSSKGKVTAKKKGTATITAKCGKKKLTCKVTVETPKLNKTKVTLKAGKTYKLKVSGTTQKIKWSSADPSVATVSSKGVVTGKSGGTVKITAKVGGKKYTCVVTVEGATNTKKQAFQNLKKYILTRGEKTEEGDSVLLWSEYDSDYNIWSFTIMYVPEDDQIWLGMVYEDASIEDEVYAALYLNEDMNSKVRFDFAEYQGSYEAYAYTDIDPATCSKNTIHTFTIVQNDVYESDAYCREAADMALTIAFPVWDEILKMTGVTFRDLGFTKLGF